MKHYRQHKLYPRKHAAFILACIKEKEMKINIRRLTALVLACILACLSMEDGLFMLTSAESSSVTMTKAYEKLNAGGSITADSITISSKNEFSMFMELLNQGEAFSDIQIIQTADIIFSDHTYDFKEAAERVGIYESDELVAAAGKDSAYYPDYTDQNALTAQQSGLSDCLITGEEDKHFNGSYDGQGHAISGALFAGTSRQADASGNGHTGIFGYFSGTDHSIKNLQIKDSCMIRGRGILGTHAWDGTVENITLSRCLFVTEASAEASGGLFGECLSQNQLKDCHIEDTSFYIVQEEDRSTGGTYGGLAGTGYALTDCSAENITIHADIRAKNYDSIGGLCGLASQLSGCRADVDISVKGTGGNIGALTGYMTYNNVWDTYIKDCQASGSILTQGAPYESIQSDGTYGTANLAEGQSGAYVGEFFAGGIAGLNSGYPAISNCESDVDITYQNCIGGFGGLIGYKALDSFFSNGSQSTALIDRCRIHGDITGLGDTAASRALSTETACTGGLIGYCKDKTDCKNIAVDGNISSEVKNGYLGGLIGYVPELSDVFVGNGYFSGTALLRPLPL